MENLSILPNPFKILDLQREKQKDKDEACNSCNDRKEDEDEDEDEEKKIEGFNADDVMPPPAAGGSMALIVILYCFVKFFMYGSLNLAADQDYQSAIDKFKKNHIGSHLVEFIFFIVVSIAGFLTVGSSYYIWGILLGFIMLTFKFIPEFVEFFENTIGYLWLILTGMNLNIHMESDNFKSSINNSDNISINFNPLITIFNIENLGEKYKTIRIDNEEENNNNNSTDFFVSYKPEADNDSGDFFQYLLEKVKGKRIIGEASVLLLSGLFAMGLGNSLSD